MVSVDVKHHVYFHHNILRYFPTEYIISRNAHNIYFSTKLISRGLERKRQYFLSLICLHSLSVELRQHSKRTIKDIERKQIYKKKLNNEN